MWEVVVLYVDAQSGQLNQDLVTVGDYFEQYLSQLGCGVTGRTLSQSNAAGLSAQGYAQDAQFATWYWGSQGMINLLEEDLQWEETKIN